MIMDAPINSAPSSVRNRSGIRESGMRQTKKGIGFFGMKAHVGTEKLGAPGQSTKPLLKKVSVKQDLLPLWPPGPAWSSIVWLAHRYMGIAGHYQLHLGQSGNLMYSARASSRRVTRSRNAGLHSLDGRVCLGQLAAWVRLCFPSHKTRGRWERYSILAGRGTLLRVGSWTMFAFLTVASGCGRQPAAKDEDRMDVEWEFYGGDAGGTKYSALSDIDRRNVGRLETAWMVRVTDSEEERPVGFRGGSGANVNPVRFESTPLMVFGSVYVSTPRNRVFALDPTDGSIRWSFNPHVDPTTHYAEDFTTRGLSAWTDDTVPTTTRCARRILLTTVDARLLALDAIDGQPCTTFGNSGVVDLMAEVAPGDRRLAARVYSNTSPPAVVGNTIVVGSSVAKDAQIEAASGVVRAFDARTGSPRWSFDPILRPSEQRTGSDPIPGGSDTATAGANVWSIISVDNERDLVFLPTASAAPTAYGGGRPGRNDFANSVVAVRGSTGDVVWSFQVVHHDIWDYDVAAQPMLFSLRRDGMDVPAVAVGTKTGMIFVLNRETGAPLFPIQERPVPQSDIPGEATWPTQPFPAELPILQEPMLNSDLAFGINETERRFCQNRIEGLRNDGPFTPPSFRGSLVWPGFWGGINWDGMAWDPKNDLIVTTVKRIATVLQLHPRESVAAHNYVRQPGVQYMPQPGTPYTMSRAPLVAPSGVPCTTPPWGSLVAVDLRSASIRWDIPLGTVPSLAHLPGHEKWGSIVFGGPLVTAGGLVFVGASQDDYFRAFDVETGRRLWEHHLPAGGQAAPMTYRYSGRQYVVIAAGGRGGIGSTGDWIVAFALPESRWPCCGWPMRRTP